MCARLTQALHVPTLCFEPGPGIHSTFGTFLCDSLTTILRVFCPFNSTATERAKLLRIYGPELFAEEARAVQGMFRMLNYQSSVDSSMLYLHVSGNGSGGGSGSGGDGVVNLDDALSHHDFSTVMRTFSSDTTGNNVEGSAVEGKDILLPTFVRKALQEMLLATDAESELFCFVVSFCLHHCVCMILLQDTHCFNFLNFNFMHNTYSSLTTTHCSHRSGGGPAERDQAGARRNPAPVLHAHLQVGRGLRELEVRRGASWSARGHRRR